MSIVIYFLIVGNRMIVLELSRLWKKKVFLEHLLN